MEQELYLIIPENMPENQIVERSDAFFKRALPQAVLYSPAAHSDKEARRIVSFFQNKNIAVIIQNDAIVG